MPKIDFTDAERGGSARDGQERVATDPIPLAAPTAAYAACVPQSERPGPVGERTTPLLRCRRKIAKPTKALTEY